MINPDERAKEVLLRFDEIQEPRRGMWDTLFQQCKDVVWPNTEDFNRKRPQGSPNTELCYDSTAPWANTQFANGIHSVIANPFERWFNLAVDTSDTTISEDPQVLAWLEVVSDMIYQCYAHPKSNHKQSIHECLLSEGCFGTSVLYQEWDEENQIPCFRSIPLSACYILENANGFVDTLYREVKMTFRQLKQRFGVESLPAKLLEDEKDSRNTSKHYHVIHAVEPRADRRPDSDLSVDMPFASDWVLKEYKVTLQTSGFETFPYHVPRWEKIAEQVYGRSPAMTALPDIRILNQMMKATIEAAQKVVNPPMILPHDSFVSQFDMTPGALNFYDASGGMSADVIRPFMTGADPKLGNEIMEPKKQFIIQCFYADMMSVPFKKERQTEVEIQARQDDMLRAIAPLIGRQESELLGPMLTRSYQLASKYKIIPPHPVKLAGKKLKIVYTSRAAFAQKGGKLSSMKTFITETVIPITQIAPEVKDYINMDNVLEQGAILSDVTRKIFRTPEEVAAIRKDRAAQQQAAQQQQAAESASTAIKNIGQGAGALPSLAGNPAQ